MKFYVGVMEPSSHPSDCLAHHTDKPEGHPMYSDRTDSAEYRRLDWDLLTEGDPEKTAILERFLSKAAQIREFDLSYDG